jgi:carbon monoxide dehydrogenase subunit G
MQLKDEFRVGVTPEAAWALLTDIERIAPCMPGAQLQEVEGDDYRGIVKVKVGPITAQYKGVARFRERDEAARRAVVRAEGRETRGQGNAAATITAQLTPDGDGTKVEVVTDLTVTGRVAQFGRGVMADVSTKLLGQFVDCLESSLLADEPSGGSGGAEASGPEAPSGGGAGGSATASPPATEQAGDTSAQGAEPGNGEGPEPTAEGKPGVRRIDSPEPEPVDLARTAGAPLAKRAGPAVVVLTVLWLLSIFLRRRRRRS